MNDIPSFVVNGIVNNWQNWATHALLWLLAGGGVWLATQFQKVRKQWEKDSVIQRFALLVSGVGITADYLVRNWPTNFIHAQNPGWLPVIAAGLFTTATFINHLKLQVLATKLVNVFQPYFLAVKQLKEAKVTASEQVPNVPDSFQ